MNKYVKISISGLLCFLMTACASISNTPTAAQKTYNSMDMELGRIMDSAGNCTKAAWNLDNDWKNLEKYKRIFDATEKSIPSDIANDKSYIVKADKKSFEQVLGKQKVCYQNLQNSIYSSNSPYVRSFAPNVNELAQFNIDIKTKFLKREINTHQAAESYKNAYAYLDRGWQANFQNNVNQLDQQHFQQLQAEAAMWQTMGSTFQNYNQQQQAYQNSYNQQQVNKPVHTQCRWDAGVMNCSSYQY